MDIKVLKYLAVLASIRHAGAELVECFRLQLTLQFKQPQTSYEDPSPLVTTLNRPCLQYRLLVSIPHLRPRQNVGGGVACPLIVGNTRVIYAVNARNLHQRTRIAATWAVDLQLSADNVELCPILVLFVQTDVLDPDEVLPSRRLGRNSELETVLVVRTLIAVDCCVASRQAGLVHLEPVARAIVVGDPVGRLGHIHETRAGVLDQLVVEDFETNPVACVDLEGLDVAAGLGTGAASQVFLGKNVGEGRVV